jgi:uncharacterized protein YjbI with pentapeptide repeats
MGLAGAGGELRVSSFQSSGKKSFADVPGANVNGANVNGANVNGANAPPDVPIALV